MKKRRRKGEEDEQSCDSGPRETERGSWGGDRCPCPAGHVGSGRAACVCVTDGGGEHPNSPPQSAPCPPILLPHIVLTLPCAVSFSTAGFNPVPAGPSSSGSPPSSTTFPISPPCSHPAPFSHPLSFAVSSIPTEGLLGGLSKTWRLCPVLEAAGKESPPCLPTAGCQAVPTSHPLSSTSYLPSYSDSREATTTSHSKTHRGQLW